MAVSGILQEVKDQILQYCHSADFQFDLALSPQGTDFQQRVWQCLIAIPAGQVRTYGDIAAELGSSPRAVGNACRANPIPLIIPCHRVVSRAGIGGFAGDISGGKVKLKQRLLRHEGVEI
ncbi:MAG: methylated-DNA--[protein]-cysteine S-methyltransferase [Gammaproteobacteria bacterium]|nr:methylated-DNA--[protein]-cysteine S-methyltransferase [Gammaproteobacteria bacterium]